MASTFRDLISRACRDGRAAHLAPRYTLDEMAKRIGVRRAHLYKLMNGSRGSTSWTIAKIAKALELEPKTVERAIEASQLEALSR